MTKKLNHIYSIGYSIFSGSLSGISLNKKIVISTLNQYSYCIAEKDPEFKKALQESNILLPDGVAIVAATKLLTGQKVKKIAGSDLHNHLLVELNKAKGSCFYLGSSDSNLRKIKDRLKVEYPNITVGCFSPPFRDQFSGIESGEMVKMVNDFKPDVLFLGMTAPKQEKWAFAYKEKLDAKVICSIGAVFDFYAGTIERPSRIWISLGLEWLGRLIKEPGRMWKRYLYYGPMFIFLILKRR